MMLLALMLDPSLWQAKITPPVPLAARAIVAAPTMAARALSVEGIDALPATPVTVTLQCAVDGAVLTVCIPAPEGGTRDSKIFWQRAFSGAAASARATDPLLRAAARRIAYYRVQPVTVAPRTVRTVLVRESISSADRWLGVPAAEALEQRDLSIRYEPFDLSDFYPSAAQRASAGGAVRTTCRVLADLSLFCTDPRMDVPPFDGPPPAWYQPAFDASFLSATRDVLAAAHAAPQTRSGASSVGRDVKVRMRWLVVNWQ